MDKSAQDNRAIQLNPNNPTFSASSRGTEGGDGHGISNYLFVILNFVINAIYIVGGSMDKAATDNRANQLNPNNPAYHDARRGKK